MYQITDGKLSDFAYAQWKKAEDGDGGDLAVYHVYIGTDPTVTLPVRNHGRIVGSKVMQPESYVLTFQYYLPDAQSPPIAGARSAHLPRTIHSLALNSESVCETFHDGHRMSDPETVGHEDGMPIVKDTFRFQRRSRN